MNFFSRRALLAMTVLALGAASGCGAVATPAPELTVTASISAATLANDCASTSSRSSGLWAGDCASTDAGHGAESCSGFCQQSNMQIAFDASAGEGSATIEVVTVRLIDAVDGLAVDTLTSRDPQRWNESEYVTWDQQLAASAHLRSSYKLSSPDWTRIGGGSPWTTYGHRYLIEVVLRVDGVERTIRSAELNREPEVAT